MRELLCIPFISGSNVHAFDTCWIVFHHGCSAWDAHHTLVNLSLTGLVCRTVVLFGPVRSLLELFLSAGNLSFSFQGHALFGGQVDNRCVWHTAIRDAHILTRMEIIALCRPLLMACVYASDGRPLLLVHGA